MNLGSWMKSLLNVKAEDTAIEKTATVSIIDPEQMSESERTQPLTISVVPNPDGSAMVVAFWQSSLAKVYEKSEKSIANANDKFTDLTSKAEKISESLVNGNQKEAEEASKRFLGDMKIATNPPAVSASTDPVESIASVGSLKEDLFTFSAEYLAKLLKPIDIRSSASGVFKGSFATLTYATHSKNHIGSDNFVLQWYPKVLTTEGMVLNVASVEKNSAEGTTYFTVPDCDRTRFEKICRLLTPTFEDIGYELKDGHLGKKANVTFMYFETPADAAEYQKEVTPVVPSAPAVPPLPKALEDAGKALAGADAGAPKGLPQVQMDKQEKELKAASLGKLDPIELSAKKKKKTEEAAPSNTPALDGTDAYDLSKFDTKEPSEKPQSADSVYSIKYSPDLGTFAIEFARGWSRNLGRSVAMGYLINEGYSKEDAEKHLNSAKKSQVELRKRAAISDDSSLVIKAAMTSVLKVTPMGRAELIATAQDMIEGQDEAKFEAALADLRVKRVVDEDPDGVHRLTSPGGGKIAEIVILLKKPGKLDAFSNLVIASHDRKEITTEDFEKYCIAADMVYSEDQWRKLASISDELFTKAKKHGAK